MWGVDSQACWFTSLSNIPLKSALTGGRHICLPALSCSVHVHADVPETPLIPHLCTGAQVPSTCLGLPDDLEGGGPWRAQGSGRYAVQLGHQELGGWLSGDPSLSSQCEDVRQNPWPVSSERHRLKRQAESDEEDAQHCPLTHR